VNVLIHHTKTRQKEAYKNTSYCIPENDVPDELLLTFQLQIIFTPKCTLADDSPPSRHGNYPRETKILANTKKKTI
jgi:hypothetical protein